MANGLESAVIPLEQIERLPKNAKSHDIGAISVSLSRWGFLERLIINRRTGHLISGHGRLDTLLQAKSSGAPMPVGLEQRDGQWLVPVDYVDLAEDQETPAAIALNRTVELGGWDESLLAPVLAEIAQTPDGLLGTGFDGDDIDRMMRDLGQANEAASVPEPQIDKAAELQKKWATAEGQIWQVGPHRLVCGDCRKVLETFPSRSFEVIFADPPYGVGKAEWDSAFASDWLLAAARVASNVMAVTPGIANLLLLPDKIEGFAYKWMLSAHISNGMVRGAVGFGNWIACVVYSFDKGSIYTCNQDCAEVVIAGDMPSHPSAKPIRYMQWLIERLPDGSILDPFCGSGTTLVAGHLLGRQCCGIESDPAYVAVTLERLAEMGLKPELIEADTTAEAKPAPKPQRTARASRQTPEPSRS